MAQVTLTEALAELKTIGKRLEKKREFVMAFLYRQDMLKDPHEKDGGSRVMLERERQAIGDLEGRTVRIRAAIADANRSTIVTVPDRDPASIADWLSWRRDIAPGQQAFLKKMITACAQVRDNAMKKGLAVNPAGETRPVDIVINVDERALAEQAEKLETVLGALDGQLSLKNATIMVEIAD